jgi:hypothetical protein
MSELLFKNGAVVEITTEIDENGIAYSVEKYLTTPIPTEKERIAALEEENALLKAQINAQSDQMDFYEDCIVEMAAIVYA